MERYEALPERLAVCQHPHGDGVWWGTEDDDPRCIQDCDCKPEVYVRAATYRGAVSTLAKIAAGPNDAPHSEPWSKAEALIALDRLQRGQ